MTYREWLHRQIEQAGCKQRWLAQAAGVSPGRIAAYMAGENEPTLSIARRICRALGAPIAALDREVDLPAVARAKKRRAAK